MVQTLNVTKQFKGISLNFPSIRVESGELVGLLGPSGSGKTTLLRMIAGLEEPTTGEIYLNHLLVNNPKILVPSQKRKVAMVFQDLALWPHMTARQHLEFVLGSRAEFKEYFDLVRLSKHLSNHYPHQLSGGEKQRLAIARSLAQNPKILLLDEPFNNLDEDLREELKKELKRVHQEMGLTTIYVTHHKEELEKLAGRIIRLGFEF